MPCLGGVLSVVEDDLDEVVQIEAEDGRAEHRRSGAGWDGNGVPGEDVGDVEVVRQLQRRVGHDEGDAIDGVPLLPADHSSWIGQIDRPRSRYVAVVVRTLGIRPCCARRQVPSPWSRTGHHRFKAKERSSKNTSIAVILSFRFRTWRFLLAAWTNGSRLSPDLRGQGQRGRSWSCCNGGRRWPRGPSWWSEWRRRCSSPWGPGRGSPAPTRIGLHGRRGSRSRSEACGIPRPPRASSCGSVSGSWWRSSSRHWKPWRGTSSLNDVTPFSGRFLLERRISWRKEGWDTLISSETTRFLCSIDQKTVREWQRASRIQSLLQCLKPIRIGEEVRSWSTFYGTHTR